MMSRLLIVLGLLIMSVAGARAQVGIDPHLVDPHGSPVIVPSMSREDKFKSTRHRTTDRPRYHIPGTLRAADHNAMGERLPVSEDFEYVPVVQARDTFSVFVFDENGNPIRTEGQVDRDYQPSSDDVIELFPSE